MRVLTSLSIAAFLIVPALAGAQAFNIDFGLAGAEPSAEYGAAGLVGYWNPVELLAVGERQILAGLDGQPTAVDIRQVGVNGTLAVDDPSTSGDHAALLEDMVTSDNDPVDACYWIDHLEPGTYEVILYGWMPDNPTELNRVRVDFASPGPVWIGGAWSGALVEGVTHQIFEVEIAGTEIGFHAGEFGGQISSWLNGVQIQPLTGAGVDASAVTPEPVVLAAYPNPSRLTQVQRLDGARGARGLVVSDVLGRVVWRTELASGTPVAWDGRTLAGGRVPAGVYYARLTGVEAQPVRLVRLD